MKTKGEVLQGVREETEHPASQESNVEGDHGVLYYNVAPSAASVKQYILKLELANLEDEIENYWTDPEFLSLVDDPDFQAKLDKACRRVIGSFKASAIYSCEDLKQDVIARFAKWLPQYRGEAQLETVLGRIAYNQLVDIYRNPNERCCSIEDLEFKGCNIAARDAEDSTAIVDSILIKELTDKLGSNRERALFTAHFVEGKRPVELAVELGISRQAVCKQLKVIVKKLKQYVE
jgi:RNA polymerase sigma factor (sigma-70 family)